MYLALGLSAWGCGDGDGDGFGMSSPAGSAAGPGLCCWTCAEHRRTRVGEPREGPWLCGRGPGRRRQHLQRVPGFWSTGELATERAEDKNREVWRGRASHTDRPRGVTAVPGSLGTKTPRVRAHSGVREQGRVLPPLSRLQAN